MRVPPGCEGLVVLPFLHAERATSWHADARLSIVGGTAATTRAHLLRALMEAVCVIGGSSVQNEIGRMQRQQLIHTLGRGLPFSRQDVMHEARRRKEARCRLRKPRHQHHRGVDGNRWKWPKAGQQHSCAAIGRRLSFVCRWRGLARLSLHRPTMSQTSAAAPVPSAQSAAPLHAAP